MVISGSNKGIDIDKNSQSWPEEPLKLPVGGAFHSPLMEPRVELEQAIDDTQFCKGICPIYQNVTALSVTNLETIKENLKKQLTASVLWTQTMQKMVLDGLSSVTEVGPGKVLQGLFKKIDREIPTESASL